MGERMSFQAIFCVIMSGVNIGAYADYHTSFSLGIGGVCGLVALMATIENNKSA
jgi:hypothetical protein